MLQNPPDDWPRASDGERDEVVARLRTAFADGRLDQGEHERRVAVAFGATTQGELKTVLDDLPTAGDFQETTPVAPEGKGAQMNPMAAWGIFTAVMFVVWAVPALVMGYPTGVLVWALFCCFWGIPAFAITMVRRRKG